MVKKIIDIARQAGQEVMAVYDSEIEVAYKADRSPLTEADTRSHATIAAGLRGLEPVLPVLSEEGEQVPFAQRKDWQRFWLVDPLDGTREFIKRNGEFTVNIALIEGRKPVLGVIYVPVRDELYYAEQGKGAFKEEAGGSRTTPLQVSGSDVSGGLRVVGSRSHGSPELESFLGMAKVSGRVAAGSSLKFCLVAEGLGDVYPRFGHTMQWDTAAGQIILQEAGGVVAGMDGEPFKYNREQLRQGWFLACRADLLEDLLLLNRMRPQ